MLLLSKEDIKKVFTMRDAIQAVKQAFQMYSAKECDLPLRTIIESKNEDGTFGCMPCYAKQLGCASVKIVCTFRNNLKKGLPGNPAQVMLIDDEDGLVFALLDGTYVTQLRTGAASGAAFDALARKDAKVGTLIGTGGQAATQLEAMVAVRDLDVVYVYDIDTTRIKPFVMQMQRELDAYGTKIVGVESCEEAVAQADMLVTMTPSLTPVFDGTKCKPGVTVSCVGAYRPNMQEMDPVILTRASKIYCDSTAAVLEESGDLLIPLADGIITEADITGDLGDVLLGNLVGREREDEIIVFETVGIGIQDLMTAKAIYDKAMEMDIGIYWS